MSRYVAVPLAAFSAAFEKAGFKRPVAHSEVVYEREHSKIPGLVVRVHTSCTAKAESARGCGEDAVRVSLVYRGQGVWKSRKVLRTGSPEAVVERALERAREAWAFGNSMAKVGSCRCGAPRYPDSKSCVNRNCETRFPRGLDNRRHLFDGRGA